MLRGMLESAAESGVVRDLLSFLLPFDSQGPASQTLFAKLPTDLASGNCGNSAPQKYKRDLGFDVG